MVSKGEKGEYVSLVILFTPRESIYAGSKRGLNTQRIVSPASLRGPMKHQL